MHGVLTDRTVRLRTLCIVRAVRSAMRRAMRVPAHVRMTSGVRVTAAVGVTAMCVPTSLPVPESTSDRHGDETDAAERETCYVDVHQNDVPFATGELEARILRLCSNAMRRHGGGNTGAGGA